MPEPVGLSIRDLGVTFDGVSRVLDGFEMDVRPGEIVALVGASGCGKSTLLRTIAGLQPYGSGNIQFVGPTLGRRPGEIAFVFQEATLLPWRTVYQNVVLPLELQNSRSNRQRSGVRHSRDEMKQHVSTALHSVGLAETTWTLFPRQLSGGMKMRTSIARALVTQPSILLLDEPFAALDDLLRTKLNQLLLNLWQERRHTILFVTHNIAEAVWLSHRIAVFGNKRLFRFSENRLSWPRSIAQRSSVEFAQIYGAVSATLAEVNQ